MVCEQLSDYRCRKAEGQPRSVGDDDVPVGFCNRLRADSKNFSATCPNFRHAGFVLRKERIIGKEHHRRTVFVDERESAVLEFAKRHGVGVEVRDLFELERGFRGYGQHVAASQKEEVLVLRKFLRDAFDVDGVRQGFLQDVREFREFFEGAAVFSEIFSALDGVEKRKQLDGGELCGKCLGRSHSDFGSGAGEKSEIGKTGDRRSYDVDDAEGFSALCLDELERFDGVGGFSRLRNEDVEGLRVDFDRGVEKFARDFGGGGHSGVFPERVASRPSRMERSSAGDEFHAVDFRVAEVLEGRRIEDEIVEIGASLEDGFHDLGLFEDLFQHEVGELALVGLEIFGLYAFERSRYERPFGFDFVAAVRLHADEVAVVEKRHLVGVSGEGLHVRSEEAFARFGIPSENQGAAVFDADEFARKIRVHYQERICAFEPRQNRFYGLDEGVGASGAESCGGFFSEEFRDDFGVGLAVEGRSGFPQFFGDFRVVFDDAVMYEEKAAFAVGMRMDVFDGHASVGRPAGMRDAERKFGLGFPFVRNFVHQSRNFAYRLEGFHSVRRVSYGYSRRIVPAVFEPFKPVEEDLVSVFAVTCVGEDSAHGFVGMEIFRILYVSAHLSQFVFRVLFENPRSVLRGFSNRSELIENPALNRFRKAENAVSSIDGIPDFFGAHESDGPSETVAVAHRHLVEFAEVEFEFFSDFIGVRFFVEHGEKPGFDYRFHDFPAVFEIGGHHRSSFGLRHGYPYDFGGDDGVCQFVRFFRLALKKRSEELVSRDLRQLQHFSFGNGLVVQAGCQEVPFPVFFTENDDLFERLFHSGGSGGLVSASCRKREFPRVRRRSRVPLDDGVGFAVFRLDFQRADAGKQYSGRFFRTQGAYRVDRGFDFFVQSNEPCIGSGVYVEYVTSVVVTGYVFGAEEDLIVKRTELLYGGFPVHHAHSETDVSRPGGFVRFGIDDALYGIRSLMGDSGRDEFGYAVGSFARGSGNSEPHSRGGVHVELEKLILLPFYDSSFFEAKNCLYQ